MNCRVWHLLRLASRALQGYLAHKKALMAGGFDVVDHSGAGAEGDGPPPTPPTPPFPASLQRWRWRSGRRSEPPLPSRPPCLSAP